MSGASKHRTDVLEKVKAYEKRIAELRESNPRITKFQGSQKTEAQRIALRTAASKYDRYMKSSNILGDTDGDYPKSLRGSTTHKKITAADAASYAAAFNMKSIKEETKEEEEQERGDQGG
jgi:hypothetical protein